jgi:uncharacterized protein with FMN-binding domain
VNRLCIFIFTALVGLTACMPADIKTTRDMSIESIDISKVKDGVYQGSYSYAGSDFLVEVTVKDHAIEDVKILEAFTGTPYSRKAQAIIDTVVAYQSVEVDVITGATTTSKAYLKCIENALRKGLE